MKRKIAIVTSSRADYAHLGPLLQELSRHPAVELQVIAMGPHFSPTFGWTGQAISWSQLTTIECLLDSDTDVGMAKTIGVATLGLADALDRLRPDMLLLIADRYEMLAPASVALALRIPIAHIEGGETTYGAIDDAVRNALTKMSHLHFACTRHASERIARMGEEPWRITFSGSLSLDRLRRKRLLSKAQVERELSLVPRAVHENRAPDWTSALHSPPSRKERGKDGAPSLNIGRDTVVCIYHPVTLLKNTLDEADEVFAALEAIKGPVIFIYPNADAGCRQLIRRAEQFVASHASARIFVNLDHGTYLSLLKHSGVLVGNSSSGIIESTSLEVPAVNVGIRQQGREHAANVIDVPAERKAIHKAIAQVLQPTFRRGTRRLKSPYGEGTASKVIARALVNAPLGPKLLFKRPVL